MTASREAWSSLDMEMYLDGELDEIRHAVLSEDLRGDPSLRARLAEIAAADALTLRALTETPPVSRRRRLPAVTAFALAACIGLLVLAGVALALRGPWGPAGNAGPVASVVAVDDEAAPVVVAATPAYHPVRTVVAVRLPPRRDEAAPPTPTPRIPEETPPAPVVLAVPDDSDDLDFVDRFETALARGGIAEVSRIVAAASEAQRDYGYRRIGELILASNADADDLLDRMTPEQQLVVCKRWIENRRHPYVVYHRLEQLALHPATADGVRALVSELATDPTQHSWLRSTNLLG